MCAGIVNFVKRHIATTICAIFLLLGTAYAGVVSLTYGTGALLDTLLIALDPDADGDPADCAAITAKEDVVTAGSLANGVVLLEDLGNDAKQYITTQATTGVSDVVEITGYFNDYNRYLVVVTSDTDNQALTIYDTDNTPVNGTELVIQNGGSNTLNMTTVAGQQQLFPAYVVIEQGESITFVYHTDRWYELARAVANVTFSSMDMGNASAFEIPNSDDPDLTATGQISFDTDGWIRGTDDNGTTQFALGRKYDTFQITVILPNSLADATRDAAFFFENNSGMTFVITSWSATSDTDNTTLNLEETDADGANNGTVDAIEIATDGTGLYYATDSTITAGTLEDGHKVWLDFDDTDVPGQVHITVKGYYIANVN